MRRVCVCVCLLIFTISLCSWVDPSTVDVYHGSIQFADTSEYNVVHLSGDILTGYLTIPVCRFLILAILFHLRLFPVLVLRLLVALSILFVLIVCPACRFNKPIIMVQICALFMLTIILLLLLHLMFLLGLAFLKSL